MGKNHPLERSTPEQAGVPSAAIEAYFAKLAENELCVHTVLMMRYSKVIAEAYAPPFHAERAHRMYSISKTFVAAAVGLAVDEGLFRLDDPVAGYFPELLPERPDPRITAATVRDLLMMACPFGSTMYGESDANWVRVFFHSRPTHAAGTVFKYNTGATVVLNALVERCSGEILTDWLRPRLFDPIGISQAVHCIKRPEGGCWGGSGILCTARDLARFGQLFLNQGRWGDKQVLPAEFSRMAVTPQIHNFTGSLKPDRRFGYGYQIWGTRHNGFAMLGMGGQMALGLPDHGFLLVTLADTQLVENGDVMLADAFWECVYPHLSASPLPSVGHAAEAPHASKKTLELPLPRGERQSRLAASIDGRSYQLDENPMGITTLRFEFGQDKCRMHYHNATGPHILTLGLGHYHAGEFPEKHYHGAQIGTPAGRGFDCMAAAAWCDERTLTSTVYITDDYLGTLYMQFVFDEDHVSLHMTKAAEWFLNEYSGFAYGKHVP